MDAHFGKPPRRSLKKKERKENQVHFNFITSSAKKQRIDHKFTIEGT
jgi:hypothetical protein